MRSFDNKMGAGVAGSKTGMAERDPGGYHQGAVEEPFPAKKMMALGVSSLILWGLYLSSLYSYLLFHTLVELFSIVVGCGIFVLAWNVRRTLDNNYLLFLGIAYLFIAFLDLTHTLAYKGMPIFRGYGADLPTQLWIAARYMQSLSLLMAPIFLHRRLRPGMAFGAYALLTLIILSSLFLWRVFPSCFVEGSGLTPFKKISEYVISLILLAALAVLFRNRDAFHPDVFRWLSASIAFTIAGELAFTFYVSVYGLSNVVGHFCKLISFYLIYKAIIQTGLKRPYNLLFRNLHQKQMELEKSEELYRDLVEYSRVMLYTHDLEGRILSVNSFATEQLGYKTDNLLQMTIRDLIVPERRPEFDTYLTEIESTGRSQGLILLQTANREKRLWGYHNTLRTEGVLRPIVRGMAHDMSDQKRQEKEREKLIQDLQKALSEVRKMSGMLPICSSCKKIRDDKGYWNQIEAYIRDHSEAEFSHGICPECMKKLYPEFCKEDGGLKRGD